jgi:hypothetical protein
MWCCSQNCCTRSSVCCTIDRGDCVSVNGVTRDGRGISGACPQHQSHVNISGVCYDSFITKMIRWSWNRVQDRKRKLLLLLIINDDDENPDDILELLVVRELLKMRKIEREMINRRARRNRLLASVQ